LIYVLTGEEYEEPAKVSYIPRDEHFSHEKAKEFLEFGKKTFERVQPLLLSLYLKTTTNEFNGFEEVQRLYEGGLNLPISVTRNPNVLEFPQPYLIQGNLLVSCHSNVTTSTHYTIC